MVILVRDDGGVNSLKVILERVACGFVLSLQSVIYFLIFYILLIYSDSE